MGWNHQLDGDAMDAMLAMLRWSKLDLTISVWLNMFAVFASGSDYTPDG